MGWIRVTAVGEDGVERPLQINGQTVQPAKRRLTLEEQISSVVDEEHAYELKRARGEIKNGDKS